MQKADQLSELVSDTSKKHMNQLQLSPWLIGYYYYYYYYTHTDCDTVTKTLQGNFT